MLPFCCFHNMYYLSNYLQMNLLCLNADPLKTSKHLCVCVCVCVCVCQLPSHVLLFETPQTVAHQASLSMEFSRQESQSGLPFPSPGDLPNSGFELWSPALQADSLSLSHQGSPNIYINIYILYNIIYTTFNILIHII